MSAEPSPRPWHHEGKCIFTADGDFIGEMEHTDDTRFVVAAVNKHGMPIVELIKAYDSLEAERDRLRDLVRRLITIRENLFWRKDEKTGLLYYDTAIDEDDARKTIEEARAAIGEEEK